MRRSGFALVTVVMIVLIMMVLLFGAMSLTSQTIIFIGNFKHRTAALYVAESGIAYAINYLERNPSATGTLKGSMQNSLGNFTVEISNDLTANNKAILVSTGKVGMFQRKIQATVEREAGAFNAISCDGPIVIAGNVFVNGIDSILYPRLEAGNIHTNYDGAGYAIDAANVSNLNITGICSAVGTINNIPDNHKKENAERQDIGEISKDSLLPETFESDTIPTNGAIHLNTKINGDLVVNGAINIDAGKVLYVTGNLTVNGGITGKGTVVVDGTTMLKGSMEIKTDNTDGIIFYSEGDITIAHPLIVTAADGTIISGQNPVAEFFAAMPEFTPLYLTHNLPASAEQYQDVRFFEWYKQNQNSQDPDFILWKYGDGTAANPGLSPEVIEWLDRSTTITDLIVNHNYNTGVSIQ